MQFAVLTMTKYPGKSKVACWCPQWLPALESDDPPATKLSYDPVYAQFRVMRCWCSKGLQKRSHQSGRRPPPAAVELNPGGSERQKAEMITGVPLRGWSRRSLGAAVILCIGYDRGERGRLHTLRAALTDLEQKICRVIKFLYVAQPS